MIDVRDYEEEDSKNIELRDIFKSMPNVRKRFHQMTLHPDAVAHTILINGEVAAIVGGFVLWKGVADVWSMTSDLVKKAPKSFHKICLTILSMYEDLYNLQRLQVSIRSDFEAGIMWARALGFTEECLMKKWGPDGMDYYLYSRIK